MESKSTQAVGLTDGTSAQLNEVGGGNLSSDGTAATSSRLLCVDLDGTLLATDSLWESLIRLFEKHPLQTLVWLPTWLLRGRAYFKQRCAQQVLVDAESQGE